MKFASAKNYARAIIDLEEEYKLGVVLQEELKAVVEAIFSEEVFSKALMNRRISYSARISMLKNALWDNISPLAQNLLMLLLKDNNMKLLPDIVKHSKELSLENNFSQEVEVQSVIKLPASQQKKLCDYFEKKTGKKIVLKNTITPEIIGGVKIFSRDMLIDGSIQGRLKKLRQHLKP